MYYSLRFFVHGKTFLPELIATWRVIVLVVALQFAGGVYGILSKQYDFWFFSLWAGAAMATLPGVVLGIAWSFKSEPTSILDHKGIVLFYVLISAALLVAAFTFGPMFETHNR